MFFCPQGTPRFLEFLDSRHLPKGLPISTSDTRVSFHTSLEEHLPSFPRRSPTCPALPSSLWMNESWFSNLSPITFSTLEQNFVLHPSLPKSPKKVLMSNKMQALQGTVGRQPDDKYLLTNGASSTGDSSVRSHKLIIVKGIAMVPMERGVMWL